MDAFVAVAIVAFCSLAVLALFVRSLSKAGASLPHDHTWLDEFSIDKYRPMLRLLSERDFEYLSMQSGFTPEIARRLRIERRKIFRAYLINLVRDFNRLQAAGRELIASASADRSDLATALFRYQVIFYYSVVALHVRLGLYTIGIGTADAREVLTLLESFRMEVANRSPLPTIA